MKEKTNEDLQRGGARQYVGAILALIATLACECNALAEPPPCKADGYSPSITVLSPQNGAKISDYKTPLQILVDGVRPIKYVEIYVNDAMPPVTISELERGVSDIHKNKSKIAVPIVVGRAAGAIGLSLRPGQNTVRLHAYTEEGDCGAEALKLVGTAHDVFAVVAGVSTYANVERLKWASEDATKFYKYLREDLEIPAENIELLPDQKATVTNLRKAVEKTIKKVSQLGTQGTLLFFFSGHGFKDADDMETTYLVPYDAELSSPLSTMIDLYGGLRDQVIKYRIARALIIIDACNSGDVPGGKGLSSNRTVRAKKAASSTIQSTWTNWTGSVVLASSDSEQLSFEDDQVGGVFTHFLLKSFREADDLNGDGFLTIAEAYEFVRREVSRYVTDSRGRVQEPQLARPTGNLDGFVVGRSKRTDNDKR